MKLANRKYQIIMILLFALGIGFLFQSLIHEMYLVIKLFYVNSINDLVTLVSYNPFIQNVYLVRVFMEFSDMNIQLSSLVTQLRFTDIIPFISLLLLYDYNRSTADDNILRFGIKVFYVTLAFKYISLIVTMLLGLGVSVNVIILIKIASIIMILSALFMILSSVLCFIGVFRISRKEV